MVDLDFLRTKHGLTEENLRTWLAVEPDFRIATQAQTEPAQNSPSTKAVGIPGEPGITPSDRRAALRNRIRSRIQEGMSRNYRDFRTYYALDQAWSTPFRQVNPTLMEMFRDADCKDPNIVKQIENWGFNFLITEDIDAKSGKPTGKKVFNLPIFFKIVVPLIKGYVTIRWAKIMNDRRLTPFFKYDPIKVTAPLRAKCEVLTDRVQVMSTQFGYYDVTKQATLQMLHYGQAIQFIKREWDKEQQWREATPEDALAGKVDNNGKKATAGEYIKVTDREGLAYHLPHPTRTYYDIAHPRYTINYDYGCTFYGYWQIARYRDVLKSGYWQADRIALGSADPTVTHALFFSSVYASCTLKVPSCPINKPVAGAAVGPEMGVGVSPIDREKELANNFYGNEHLDQGVLVTEHFEKIIPKDDGLGTYDCPVWFRFVVAGDGGTILYAAPLPSAPGIYYGYDANESQSINAGMTLEALPFQDHFSNTLSQINLTARQNLANLVLLDDDQLTDKAKESVSNLGEKFFRMLNVFAFSGKKAFKGQNKITEVAHSVSFPKGNVAELTQVLKLILDIMERILVMSSQEVAQAASHEQTREEIRNIAQTSSSRLTFTATPVDIARDAWKRQLYCYLMQYGDDDIYAQIPAEIRLTKEALTALGFSYVDLDVQQGAEKFRTVRTTKQSIAVPLWSFASTRDGEDRLNDEKIAVALATLWDKVMSNPITAQAVGPEQALDWANKIGQLAGIDRDFRLRNISAQPGTPEHAQQAREELRQVLAIVLPQVDKEIKDGMAPLMDAIKQQGAQIGQNTNDIAALVKIAEMARQAAPEAEMVTA